jgi:hypothetical protein
MLCELRYLLLQPYPIPSQILANINSNIVGIRIGIIVRLYESQRKRGRLGLSWEANLLEENESAWSVENDSIQLN